MRVLIDTNVLISAALYANSISFQAYIKAASYPNRGLICEQNVDELKRIFNKKFPEKTIWVLCPKNSYINDLARLFQSENMEFEILNEYEETQEYLKNKNKNLGGN